MNKACWGHVFEMQPIKATTSLPAYPSLALLLACAEIHVLANCGLSLSTPGIVTDNILLAKCTGTSCVRFSRYAV